MLWAFDLIQLNSNDLRRVALADRKRRLGHLIERAGIDCLKNSKPLHGRRAPSRRVRQARP
jgi:ATP-dependent DNA ligase